ncbi:tRNA lysidine(34) synthetase TilS [Rubellicoccus peritrichatus]|uniref:tRNA(Ile)-lysidine synthase n=1 Tax=Rubellicoccus peritrichatus TaxID=3080537 RepID=A0AAQ3LBF3_9BACT|nr:tRNA lysidine(34) synthetase TilS [Puniceicoccus sp. CR14]WOO41242.1 tRNA lysidine(34) synthetase TilS [Puniceicoccus sp. CR14]
MSKVSSGHDSKQNWQSLAVLLSARLAEPSLHPDAMVALEESQGSIGIACSGGADSLCLLLLIWERFPQLRERMIVLHYNHGLRGEESDNDEVFVSLVAKSLGIISKSKKETSELGYISEESLRKQRLAFFRESTCLCILQGHHGDDVLETILMRICRGSGTDGLSAPRPVHRHRDGLTFVRPLLAFERKTIQQALKELDIPWREDQSNTGRDFFRNRIRHDVVPALKSVSEHNPVAGALRTRTLLEEDSYDLDHIANSVFLQEVSESLTIEGFSHSRAILRRIVHHWLIRQGDLRLSAAAMDQLVTQLVQKEPITLAAGGGFIEFDGILLRRKAVASPLVHWSPIPLIPDTKVFLPEGFAVHAALVDLTDEWRERILSGKVDVKKEAFIAPVGNIIANIWLRKWMDGDRYRPLGSPGSKKLQDIFTNAKIPRMERKRIPLVCFGDENIAWIPGFPPAEAFKITKMTKQALWLTCDQT